ncbi:hypothetical protein Pan153_15590 [Gimesia panareensis]|uniref:Uncharacterized protein n=1 Tax=Gimesia panareensis TaxID=2527978 RepID=A0A518FKP4_9PLAN|nr:hypothetical protein [Gimesia panareensis]QDV16925.1 hypothetical protein Pan153_15590 [Gimesia panareensis]
MEKLFEVIGEINGFLTLLASLAAFLVVLTWPRVRGKGWLAGGLGLILLGQSGWMAFRVVLKIFGSEPIMGADRMLFFRIFSLGLTSLTLLGTGLLVVGVIQLGGWLKAGQSSIWED